MAFHNKQKTFDPWLIPGKLYEPRRIVLFHYNKKGQEAGFFVNPGNKREHYYMLVEAFETFGPKGSRAYEKRIKTIHLTMVQCSTGKLVYTTIQSGNYKGFWFDEVTQEEPNPIKDQIDGN